MLSTPTPEAKKNDTVTRSHFRRYGHKLRDKRVRWRRRARVYALIPLSMLLVWLASLAPGITESVYSLKFFRAIALTMSALFGWVPFSLAEFVVLGLVFGLLFRLIRTIKTLVNHERSFKNLFKRSVAKSLSFISIGVFAFVVLWGINYQRIPLAETLGLDHYEAKLDDLTGLANELAQRCSALRSQVSSKHDGSMKLSTSVEELMADAPEAYADLAKRYAPHEGQFGRPKPVAFSPLLSHMGIAGMYFPFTGEVNINTEFPDCTLPFNIYHEIAHQHGYAHEDEANFLAYLACTSHKRADIRYSGNLIALRYVLIDMTRFDAELAKKHYAELDNKVRHDLASIDNWYSEHHGWLRSISAGMNNIFLKANGQSEGILAYTRVVDLLVADWHSPLKRSWFD